MGRKKIILNVKLFLSICCMVVGTIGSYTCFSIADWIPVLWIVGGVFFTLLIIGILGISKSGRDIEQETV